MIRFLADENFNNAIIRGVKRIKPAALTLFDHDD